MQLQDIKSRLTFVIPVRIDCEERLANLHTVCRYLAVSGCRIIVLEAASEPALLNEGFPDGVECLFVEDKAERFHRTRYINDLLRMADTDIVAVWDADVLAGYAGIGEAVHQIQEGSTIAYPYNGQMVMLSEQVSAYMRKKPDLEYLHQMKLRSFLGRRLCGGAYLVHRQRYAQCGGENERFTGWGPDDAERMHRVRILGHRVTWAQYGQLYHLHHPDGANSVYRSETDADGLRREFIKVCSMLPDELKSYLAK